MKNIFLFPGQGSQFQGMMMDLYESSSLAKKTIDKFSEISGEVTKIDPAKGQVIIMSDDKNEVILSCVRSIF